MQALLRISAAIDRLSAAVGRLVAWLVLLMVVVGSFNAIARYLGRYVGTNLSSNAWIELQWYLFSLVFLLGASWALATDQHVRVDVLYGRLSDRGKAWIDVVGAVVFLLPFCGFALWVSVPAVINSWAVWEQSPDPGGLPRYPIKTAIPVAFVLLFAQGVSQLIKGVAFLRGDAGPPGAEGPTRTGAPPRDDDRRPDPARDAPEGA